MSENNAANQTATPTAKPKRWKRRLAITVLLLIPLGFAAWICLFRDTPLEISKETTYITEPLTADGRVDYFRALEQELYPPGMKTDENGYRLIVRALGPSIDPKEPGAADLAKQVYEKLGLDPNSKPTMTYEAPYSFLERYVKNHPKVNENKSNKDQDQEEEETDEDLADNLDDKAHRPWTLDELPMMEKWLEQNGPALDVIGKAVRKPEFRRPWMRNPNSQELFLNFFPNAQNIRDFARGLSVRIYYRIGTGDLDGAIHDIITCHALGRQVGKQGSIVNLLVGVAIEGIAKAIPIAGSLDHQPTQAQLQRLVEELQKLPKPCTLEDTTLYERYYILSAIQYVATTEERKNTDKFAANGLDIFYTPTTLDRIAIKSTKFLGFNWNAFVHRLNMYYDDPRQFKKLRARISASNKPLYLSFGMLLPTPRSEILADCMAAQWLGNIDAIKEVCRRQQCGNRIQQITLAMLLYEKQHGRLPPAYTVDQDGKPLHSWRVLLLPYLGEEAKELYGKIKLDEPWDSEHNRQFHDAAVPFYQCPSVKLKPGQTTYSVAVGEKTAFGAGEGKTLGQLGPESVNMILVLESPTPGCWMDPASDLIEVAAREVLDHDEDVHPGVIVVGLRSGSVTIVSKGLNREAFRQGLEGTKSDWLDPF